MSADELIPFTPAADSDPLPVHGARPEIPSWPASRARHPIEWGGGPIPVIYGVLRPFQRPSLQHLDLDVERALTTSGPAEGLRETTLRWWGDAYRAFRKFLVESHGERAFLSGDAEMQRGVLRSWIATTRARGVSHVGVRTYWRGLSSLFDRVCAADSTGNPLRLLAIPRAAMPDVRCLPRASAETVLSFIRRYPWLSNFTRSRNLAVVGLMLLAGLRRGEVLRLRCDDLVLGEQALRIVRGKGRDGGKDRMAYTPPQLVIMLEEYVRARRAERRVCPYLLTQSRRDAPLTPSCIHTLFRVISARSGIRVSAHVLRHTYATLLRQSGVPDRVAMDLLGHSSLVMLQRYSHVFSGEHRDAARRVWLDEV